jgi:hypothetical protein
MQASANRSQGVQMISARNFFAAQAQTALMFTSCFHAVVPIDEFEGDNTSGHSPKKLKIIVTSRLMNEAHDLGDRCRQLSSASQALVVFAWHNFRCIQPHVAADR